LPDAQIVENKLNAIDITVLVVFAFLMMGYLIREQLKDDERDGSLISRNIIFGVFIFFIIGVLYALMKFNSGLCEGNLWPEIFKPNHEEPLHINCNYYVIAAYIPLAIFIALITWNGLVQLSRIFRNKKDKQ
jgi:hypothetical protein